jgi:uncharacterized protein (TIGR02266 family)
MGERRRDPRHPVRLPIILHRGPHKQALLTEDVSVRGVFVRTDDPPPIKALVRVEMVLPTDSEPLVASGVVAHRVQQPTEAAHRSPGAGIHFYDLPADQLARWRGFVDWAAERAARIARPLRVSAPMAPEPVRRSEPRRAIQLRVRVRTEAELHTLYTRDLSRGGMFLATELPLAVGDRLRVELVHPTTNESFPLRCRVRHRLSRHGQAGVGVQFEQVGPAAAAALEAFVRTEED